MTDELKARCDRAVREGRREAVDLRVGDPVPQDITELFRSHTLREATPQPREGVKAETVGISDAELKRLLDGDSADPDFVMIDDSYMITTPDKTWFVAFVAPMQSTPERVRRFATRKKLFAYWPRSMRVVQRGRGAKRKSVTLVRSVFHRYILVHLSHRDPEFGVLSDHEGRFNGIGEFVSTLRGPIAIPDVLVERIVERERAGEFNDTMMRGRKRLSKLPEWCEIGAFARIKDGPFMGFTGLIETVDEAKSRLRVAVSILGRATPVELELTQVEGLC